MSRALAFLAPGRPLDYGARLSRLRWRRAAGALSEAEWPPAAPAGGLLGAAEAWLVVLEAAALPVLEGGALEPVAGQIVVPAAAVPEEPRWVHTLRELEAARLSAAPRPAGAKPAAMLFRARDFPARDDETIELYINRLQMRKALHTENPAFRIVGFDEPSDRERPELTRRLPEGRLRILDVGCGAGGAIAGARPRRPEWSVTGIEADADLAARARARCDEVLEGDLREILPRLARSGERFDAVVFADVLEHLEDPISALESGRRVAAEGARLVVSVPNVGHLSIVRDLVAGRFDPVPAGLTDARHLRWFTRPFLAEALAEAGWRDVSIEGEAGAPAPDAGEFLALASTWPGGDLESLRTYQWIAVAVNRAS